MAIPLINRIMKFFSRDNNKLIPYTAVSSAIFIPTMFVVPHFQKDMLFSFFRTLYVVSFYPFKIGDKIKVNGKEGTVENMDMQFVVLENKRSRIYIPTNSIYNSTLEVFNN